MTRAVSAVRRYPSVALTVLVGIVGVVLVGTGHADVAGWVLSGFAVVVAAFRTASMVRDVLHGTWGIDILAVTAIVATVVVGQYWAALVVVLMLTGGEALEDFAAGRAQRELTALIARAPHSAHRVNASGVLDDVEIDQVAVDDELAVRPGEVVPVDGLLLTGAATLDESSITGEAMPVERVAGDALMSGAVNGAAGLRLRATASAADSQYQQIVALVAQASGSKAPFVRLADRVAVPFTLVAFVIAGLAWALSGDAVRFAEVLVVATPCPLLIATPVAFMAGMSRAARGGIIIKNGGTLERLARVRTVAFDKTGTLTRGTPQLVDVLPAGSLPAGSLPAGVLAAGSASADPQTAGGMAPDELLRLTASVEQGSGHALATSVVAAAADRGLALAAATDVVEQTGRGVRAHVDGHDVVVGQASFVGEHTTHPVDEIDLVAGHLAVYVVVDGRYAGLLTFADVIRPESRDTLHELRRLGVRTTVMLTGDGAVTARHVAEALGINEVRANCLPADKVAAVAALPDRPVLMVGDGVNDAPVLAAADVGIAMGAKGSTAASESADVVIMLDDLGRVASAIGIGRRTITVAMQAIAIGVGLSLVLMVIASTGAIPAIVGAGLQELVDLATILWALRATRPGALETGAHDVRLGSTVRGVRVVDGTGPVSVARPATQPSSSLQPPTPRIPASSGATTGTQA